MLTKVPECVWIKIRKLKCRCSDRIVVHFSVNPCGFCCLFWVCEQSASWRWSYCYLKGKLLLKDLQFCIHVDKQSYKIVLCYFKIWVANFFLKMWLSNFQLPPFFFPPLYPPMRFNLLGSSFEAQVSILTCGIALLSLFPVAIINDWLWWTCLF